MSSTWLARGSRSHLFSEGDSSCLWVLVHALDPVSQKEWQAIMLGGRWNVNGESEDSSTLAVDVEIVPPSETRSLWRIQTLSLSTAFINYSWDWLDESSVVQTEEVMLMLQNTLLMSKLLNVMDSAIVLQVGGRF